MANWLKTSLFVFFIFFHQFALGNYDAAYRTKVLKDGRGNPTTYTYNANGYLSEVLYPAGGGDKVRYTSFDPVGNVLQRSDGNGAITNYLYEDLDGLLSSVSYPATPGQNISLTYDAYDRLSGTGDGSGTQGKTYDDLNNTLTSTTTYTGLSAKTLSYQYYPDGSRQQLGLAGSGLVNYLYDAAGRPQTMAHPLGSASWAHFDNNWTQRRTLNGVAYTDYLYNPIGMLTRLTNKNSAGTLTHSDYTGFTYDGVFNLTGLTASVPGTPSYSGTSAFGYDTKDRLTGDQSTKIGGYNYSFGYDDSFNPTTFKGVSQSFNSNNQQTGAPFVYDLNGNPTTYKGTACTFDPENRLTSYGAILTAGYRADGMRAWKQNSSGRTYFIYDGITPVLELNSAGSVVNTNIFALDGLVARRQGATDIHYLFDQQGNVAHRLNSSGTTLSSSTFDAYGIETKTSDQQDPFGYNARWGYYKDRETGLYLCTWRYYDPEKGRWLNRDPIGYLGGVNLYGYCGQRPVSLADKSGAIPFVLPPNPGGLPPGWWQGGHGGPLRQEGSFGRYFPPGGSEEGSGLEFHPGKPGAGGNQEGNHWHGVKDGEKEDEHLEPGEPAPAYLPDCGPEVAFEGSSPFWRWNNPWAWAAGAGIAVAAGAAVVASGGTAAPAVLGGAAAALGGAVIISRQEDST